MSVILFTKAGVYQELADCYEGLKEGMRVYFHRPFTPEDDYQFYKSLRRLYFANVATFLCQYHDETPENTEVDTFIDLKGKRDPYVSFEQLVNTFVANWKSLKYNLVTNDGEQYRPVQAYEWIDRLAVHYMEALIEKYATSA